MANVSTKLPSPNSRRKPDRSNLPPWTNIQATISPDAGKARVIVNQNVAINGVPQAILTGGTHAAPLTPITIEQVSLVEFLLTFAESVELTDRVTWPERDPAIRSRIGGYVNPMSYVVAAPPAAGPSVVAIEYNLDTQILTLTFDQDIAMSGDPIAGLIQVKTPDGATITVTGINDIFSNVLKLDTMWQDNMQVAGFGTSTALGTVINANVGGALANDFSNYPVTQTLAAGEPHLINAAWTAGTQRVTLYWNQRVLNNISGVNVRATDATERRLGTSAATQINFTTLSVHCNFDISPAVDPNTCEVDADAVDGFVSGIGNLDITGYPMPTV